jgi:Subtilase family/IPT/TIG domain
MSFRSVSLLAVGGLVIATLAAATAPTSAAPSTADTTPGAAKLDFGTHRSWPGSHVPSHGKPPRPARTTAPARIPHLDPRLQTAPPSRDGTIEVTLRGDARALAGAVAKVGGRSIASIGDAMSAVVPRSALATLAGTPGVTSVEPPVRAYPDVTSEGVATSNANVWQSAGKTGQNVKVGIVDVGFANLTAEKNAGRLPANTTVKDDCGGHPDGISPTDHGTGVAEIVHQMAPAAQLYLYCITDTTGFAAAEQHIADAGDIKIVNSSLGFPGDSRGDGTGGADSAATTVQKARQAGILWIQSAGNNAEDHWSGTLQDADADGWVDLNGTGTNNEADGVFIPSGQSALLVMKWDNWPTVSQAVPLSLDAVGWQCVDAHCSSETALNGGQPITVTQQANTPPVLAINVSNGSSFDQEWDVFVHVDSTVPQVGYDLSYWGAVSQSYLASVNPGRAAAGSITEPADSPSAFAVGAANWQGCGVEPFSSRGPTIDGRIKPDITGFDGVSSNLADLTPFYGTSAAAPHVAGAAAIVAGANSTWNAAQIQDFLQSRAGTTPNNTVGYGVLNLGLPSGTGQPAVTGVSPAASAVGTTVTISGRGFITGQTTVKFGGVASRTVTVRCATRVVASVPARPLTSVDVTVTAQGGASPIASGDRFTYRPLVTAAVDPRTKGYWLTTPQGSVYQFGATWYGSKSGVSLPAPIVGMAADPDTGGYWMVTSKGNVYNFNAPFYGSTAGKTLPAPIVSITSTGHGYLLATSKGNVYNFNAPFHGSMAGKTLPAPIVSITSSGNGYLLVTSKGNVYNFNAPFHGSMAGKSLPAPISGVAADPATGGYWLTTTKGNVYNFNAPFYGSAANTSLPAPVVTIDTSGAGYLLTTSAGNVLHYNATYFGSPADRG